MESQLASARVLFIAAAAPVAVFLCLRTAGVEVGLALGGGASTPSSDVQVIADFTAPTTSADDRFDRRAGTRASVTLGRPTREPGTTTKPGGKGAGSGGGGGNNNNGGGTDPTPPPPPPPTDPLQQVKDAIKPVTDVTDPVVKGVTGTVSGTLDDVTGSLPPLPETPSLP
jgi:hypothetical protein